MSASTAKLTFAPQPCLTSGLAGVGTSNTFTPSPAPGWSSSEWNDDYLLDSAGTFFAISDTSSTALTVSGTPASGPWQIIASGNPAVDVVGQLGVTATLYVTNGQSAATTVAGIYRTSTPAASGTLASNMAEEVVGGAVPGSGTSIGFGDGVAQFRWVDQYQSSGPAFPGAGASLTLPNGNVLTGPAYTTGLTVVLATGENITVTTLTGGTVTVDVFPDDPTGA